MATTEYSRGVNYSLVSQMPPYFDVITANATASTGDWVAIKVYNPSFPNDATSFVLGNPDKAEEVANGAKGVNLSSLNGLMPNADILVGHFTKIHIPVGNTMRIIAYKP